MNLFRTAAVLTIALLLCAGNVLAQAPPPAKPEDVKSVGAILTAVYDVISGPAGQKRNWDRMRSLFVPGARLIPVGKRPTGDFAPRVMDVETYIGNSGPMEAQGFFEKEIYRTEEAYGNIVHAFSTYESRRRAEDPAPFARGINSFQLMNDGQRWWIVTIYWQAESPDNPIPAKYLPKR